jgi:glucokinase
MEQNLPTRATIDGREVCLRLGVDMGGSDIKFGATNLKADLSLLSELVKRPSSTDEGPQATIAQIIDGISAVLEQLAAHWSDVADISVTVPCPCARDGTIIEATNLGTDDTKELWKVPFGELLAESVQEESGAKIPVFACNDANAAGQDDDFVRFGLDASRRTGVFITTGTGLGGCVMVNGAVFFGRGQAGELGHVKPAVPAQYQQRFAEQSNPQCGCGGFQCTEATASLTGLTRRIAWALSDQGIAVIEQELLVASQQIDRDVVGRLRKYLEESPKQAAYHVRTFADRDQDAFCRWLLEDWAIMIGLLFASVAPILHPDLLIIGGGLTEISSAGKEWFIGVVRRVYAEVNAQHSFLTQPGNCEIVWSVSQDQGWRGAILMGIRAKQA